MLFFITTSLGAKSAPRFTLFNNRESRLQRYEGLRQPVAKMLRHSHEKTTCLASNRCQSQVCEIKYFPLPPFKVVPPSFEHGLVLLATLKRGGGGVTSTRSWTGHLSQNTVQCLNYFCNWLSHLRFTSNTDFHVSTSQSEDYSEKNKQSGTFCCFSQLTHHCL